MPRYRNEDNVCIMINRIFRSCKTVEQRGVALAIKQAFLEIKPDDVVPRAEVENYAEWSGLKQAKQDAAREIFAEINAIKKEYASGDIDGNELYVRLYMLEKKYTEGE